MRKLVQALKLSGSTAAMIAAISGGPAQAQDQNASPETVVVSASRIAIQGYTAPTPVTVVDSATLARDAHVDLGQSIRELPAVGQSWSPDTGSNGGQGSQGDADLNTIDLRDLGNIRTLVLFDGQRVVMSNPNNGTPPFAIGGVDLNTIPQTVIQRVEVVTGGASAAWGSDAVAGVVNLVINKTFTGIKGNLTLSDSYLDDHRQYKGEIFIGSDFLGGRAHVEFAGNYVMSPDLVQLTDRGWYWGQPQTVPSASLKAIGTNVTGLPTWIHVYGAISQSGSARQTNGGLITSSINPATGKAYAAGQDPLAGIQFIGPNAQPAPFNFGAINGSNCVYCSGTPYNNTALNQLAVPYHNFALFNYDSYRLTDSITASIQLNYGQSYALSTSSGRNGNVIIHSDNPFIPAPVKAIMTANGITSFTLGTSNANNLNFSTIAMNDIGDATGLSLVRVQRQLMRGVFSLDGTYSLWGDDWTWNAYAQNSTVRQREHLPYNTIAQNYSNATDPITVTATGSDSLGGGNPALAAQVTAALKAANIHVPQVGEIACRSTLTATSWGTVTDPATGLTTVLPGGLTPGCAPLDQFGEGVASVAAQNYIAPGRINPAYEDTGFWYMNQAVFAISTQGQLPWGLSAGKVAVATGYEHRLEQQTNRRDALNLGSTGAYPSGNFASWQGHYFVDEAFLEVTAPILKDDIVQSFEFNAAGRVTDYSTSGVVETWKLGITSQVNEDFRLRTTLSSDIRAPDVSELFSAPLFAVTGNSYPPPNGPLYQSHVANSGNPDLVPEEAITVSGGVVFTPHWIENLSVSLDWYSISIHKAIYANALPDILHQCAIGNPVFCANVFFGHGFPGNTNLPVAQEIDGNGKPASGFFASVGTFPADCPDCFNLAFISPLNAASETTSGLDFQADYNMDLWGNPLNWHLVGNYTDERTNTVLGIKFDGAGIYGGAGYVNPLSGLTSPKLRFNVAATYDVEPFEITVQSRFIGSARFSPTYVEGVDIDKNWIPPVAYLDLRASYQWNTDFQLYFAIDNTLNTPPAQSAGSQGGLGQIYDELGRALRAGVRFNT